MIDTVVNGTHEVKPKDSVQGHNPIILRCDQLS